MSRTEPDDVFRFLQSPSSNLVIMEDKLLVEHGTAVISCLISGLDAFMNRHREQDTRFRVVKGLHALHIYATEYWAEYVLAHAASDGSATPSSLIDRACQLSDQLDKIVGLEYTSHNEENDAMDERLMALQHFPGLRHHIERFLRARSLAQLKDELRRDSSNTPLEALSANRS